MNLLTTGTILPNPSELLMKRRFREFLENGAQLYDLFIVDAPPVLAVTDAAIMASPHAGALFMVMRTGVSSAQEVGAAAKRIEQNHRRLTGVLLNGIRRDHVYGRTGTYYYHYNYSSVKGRG